MRARLLVATLLLVGCEAPAIALPDVLQPPPPAAVALRVRALGPDGPLGRARICASSPSGAPEVCGTTDVAGEVALRVRPGTFMVRGEPPAGPRLRSLGVVALDAAAGAQVTMLFEALARIAGLIRDEQGRPVAAAEICAHPAADDPPECVPTRPDGRFALEARPGIYRLQVSGPPDGSRLIPQWARGRVASFEADLYDTRAGDVTGIEVVLVRGHVLSGTIVAARDGAAVKEAQVCTQTLAAPLPWDCDRSDKNGRYAILRQPGSYWVWTIPPDDSGRLLPQRYDAVDLGVDATPLRLDADRILDVALREGPLLTGRITTTDGAVLPDALVCVDTPFPTGRICRPTDSDGRYRVATRPDVYTVQIVPPAESDAVSSYWPGKRDWTDAGRVLIAGDTTLDVSLPRGVRLTGVVRTELGSPVEAAPVSVNDGQGFLTGTYTDHAGRRRGTGLLHHRCLRAAREPAVEPGRAAAADRGRDGARRGAGVRATVTLEQGEPSERSITKEGAADDRVRADDQGLVRLEIAREQDAPGLEGCHPLHDPAVRVARVSRDDDVSGMRRQADVDQPVAVAQGRLHRVPGHGDAADQARRSPPWPGACSSARRWRARQRRSRR